MRARAASPLPWLGGLLALYLLAPIAAFALRLSRSGASSAPGLGRALATSLFTATVSALVVTALGVPLAYLLAQHRRSAVARLLTALVALPLALPPLMSGLLLLYVLGPYTTAGRLFGGQLTDTRLGIVLAQTFVAAPFLIIAARAAFAAVDPALDDVAATLGHGPTARFRLVAVPVALPGIAAGVLLAWLRAFGEFGATIILAYHPYSLPVFTYVQFDATGLPATMLPIAAALAAALVVLLVVQLPLPRRRRAHRHAKLQIEAGGSRPAGAALLATSDPAAPSQAAAPLHFSVRKRLGAFSLNVAHQGTSPHLALLGASGAGKTLTLRLLAGLTHSDGGQQDEGQQQGHGHGSVTVEDRALHKLAPERRGIGYVPQQPALLPRRSVWRQVTLGAHTRDEHAAWWIQRLGLAGLEDRYPHELSGGQQRRVALARALASQPRMLLLDEPFSGLDAPVRQQMCRELRRIQSHSAIPTVLVTHDPEEAALLAQEIIVIDHGHTLQAGTRQQVFRAPNSPRVAALLGIPNTHHGVVRGEELLLSGDIEIRAPTTGLPHGSDVVWSVRPEQIVLDAAGAYRASVLDDVDLGVTRELTILLGSSLELILRTSHLAPSQAPGEDVRVNIDPNHVSLWPRVATVS